MQGWQPAYNGACQGQSLVAGLLILLSWLMHRLWGALVLHRQYPGSWRHVH
jgi:hypothetical protein